MTFMLLLLSGVGFVALVLGVLAAMVVLPYSKASSAGAQLGIVLACLGGSLFVVTSAGVILFMIAFGLSDM